MMIYYSDDNTSQTTLALTDVTSQPITVAVVSSVDHVTNFNQSSVGEFLL